MKEGQRLFGLQVVLPEDKQEVQLLLSLLHQGPDVEGLGVVSEDVGGQKREGDDGFHPFSIYEEGGVVLCVHLEVHNTLFCPLDIPAQVVF